MTNLGLLPWIAHLRGRRCWTMVHAGQLSRLFLTLKVKESRYFCDSLFWASQPKQAAKDYATVILLRKPRYPWHNIVPTQQGDRNIVPIVDAAYREASVFHLRVATDQHPALCSYRGLKIFTSLSLRFQDFQRMPIPNTTNKYLATKNHTNISLITQYS